MLTTLVDCCLTVICNNIGRYKSFGDLSPKIAHVLYTWLKREKALDAHVFSLFFDCPFTALDLAKTNEDWVKVMASDSEHTRMKESLTLLDISHNPSLTDQGLQTLCALFPKLTHLILEGCKQVTGTAFADARPFKTVQYLNVGNTSVLGENITKLASLPALVKLDLTNCREFKNDHLEHLAKHLSNLTELVLSNCDQIDGDGLSTLTHLPALRVLKLRYCVNINAGTKDPFVEWASTPLSQKLQALNLSGSATPVVTYQPPVTHLDLAFCQLSEERLASLGKLSGLQALDLVSAHNLNATSFPLLFGESGERLPELEMLNLSMCNQIRDTELLHLKGLTKLKSLNLSSCNLITSAGVLKLKQHLPSVVFDVRGCRGVNASEVMDSPTKNPLVTTNPLVYDTVHQRRRQPNVLVVEDGAMPAMILKMVFERHNYQVDIAENGVIGLELFTNSDKYDLVVMDIFMPKMDGIACTKMIRDYERKHAKRPTPIIIQTADTREAYKQLCLDAGCNGFVNKPFPKDLIVMAQSLLA